MFKVKPTIASRARLLVKIRKNEGRQQILEYLQRRYHKTADLASIEKAYFPKIGQYSIKESLRGDREGTAKKLASMASFTQKARLNASKPQNLEAFRKRIWQYFSNPENKRKQAERFKLLKEEPEFIDRMHLGIDNKLAPIRKIRRAEEEEKIHKRAEKEEATKREGMRRLLLPEESKTEPFYKEDKGLAKIRKIIRIKRWRRKIRQSAQGTVSNQNEATERQFFPDKRYRRIPPIQEKKIDDERLHAEIIRALSGLKPIEAHFIAEKTGLVLDKPFVSEKIALEEAKAREAHILSGLKKLRQNQKLREFFE